MIKKPTIVGHLFWSDIFLSLTDLVKPFNACSI